jgi:hypothetical protein
LGCTFWKKLLTFFAKSSQPHLEMVSVFFDNQNTFDRMTRNHCKHPENINTLQKQEWKSYDTLAKMHKAKTQQFLDGSI